jgi:hypothetical protein
MWVRAGLSDLRLARDLANPLQISYFGPDGLLRRHEYRVDVPGGAPGPNYAHEFREVDGILVARKHRVYSFDTDKCKIPDPVLVAIDIHKIAFSQSVVSSQLFGPRRYSSSCPNV